MKQLSQSIRSNNRGFTLLEILIVLGILGTIMTMVIGRVTESRNRAKVKEAHLSLSQISESINMYYNDCGKYPATLQSLTAADAECNQWEPANKLKIKDPWGTDFAYAPEGSTYTLKSLGQDKKEGGSGNDADIEAGSGE